MYDHKNIASDIFIGELNLELRRYLEKLGQTLSRMEVDAELKTINRGHAAGEQTTGFIQVTVQLLSQSEASSLPVGVGREAPNRDPRLTTPEDGRTWDEWLQSRGLTSDMSSVWYWLRISVIVITTILLFVFCFLYPALFWL